MSGIVYLNGAFIPASEATVSIEDRGFVFADAVYEVIRCYRGRPFRLREHLIRLENSARAIRLELPLDFVAMERLVEELLEKNDARDADVSLYLQVTRGPSPRNHPFPQPTRPTVVMVATRLAPADSRLAEEGVTAITLEDRRWHMCHLKTVGLLPNVLAKQDALDAGAFDAIFLRDGVVTEASSANFFGVMEGTLWTHPEGPHILSGVTRGAVLDIARQQGIPLRIEPIPADRLAELDEAFLSGTGIEILPVVRIDGRVVGTGTPGPITRTVQEHFHRMTRNDQG